MSSRRGGGDGTNKSARMPLSGGPVKARGRPSRVLRRFALPRDVVRRPVAAPRYVVLQCRQIVSEHYNRGTIADATALERFYFAKGVGRLRWSAWNKTGRHADPTRCLAVPYDVPPGCADRKLDRDGRAPIQHQRWQLPGIARPRLHAMEDRGHHVDAIFRPTARAGHTADDRSAGCEQLGPCRLPDVDSDRWRRRFGVGPAC